MHYTDLCNTSFLKMPKSSSSEYLRQLFQSNENILLNPDAVFEDRIITYWDLEQYLLINNEVSALQILQKLHLSVNTLVQHINAKVVNDATVDIIFMFLNENSVLNRHHNELKQKFGEFTFNTTKSLFMLVNEFKDVLSIDGLLFLNNMLYSQNCDIRYRIPTMYLSNNHVKKKIKNLRPNKPNKASAVQNFSMLYNTSNVNKSLMHSTEKKEDIFKLLTEYNTTEYSDEFFCDNIIDIIMSTKEFKTQLYNYVGFEHFELYEFLKRNKVNILKHFHSGDKRSDIVQPVQPSYGTQVTVQSKQEKDLLKMLKKVEKKKKSGQNEYASEYNQIKEQHEVASVAPILKRSAVTEVLYPNVYDSKSNRRVHMTTTAEHSRVDRGAYEEVTVKPEDKTSMPKMPPLVAIENLDHIGQIIFRDTKYLNTIQTVVFPVAYSTNENMLICAPTGAGKTNIALLTIANQIKQFTNDGVVDHSKFKIVYIVPMKALAAEVTANFTKKLGPLGISVKELTGDMQLTTKEIKETQLLVTTPEKWDVVTRKGTGDNGITDCLKLLIIDEVHLLHGDRGPVIEALVARTKRLVETSQSMIRIIGLSATLPNYIDVARFLNVNLNVGLFYFDGRFRPVPLTQVFIGVKPMKQFQALNEMDNACYDKVLEFVQKGHQCMVFVHARNMTVHTANVLKEKAMSGKQIHLFEPQGGVQASNAKRQAAKSANKILGELMSYGFAVHHAGLLRSDRNLVEKFFREGVIRVLVCTATLAWGVNLPAHGVIIKGTEVYNSKKGTFVPLDILDVLQIFGRAGRPQFDNSGTGVIITTHCMLNHYLQLLTHQIPIESSFLDRLPDHLNAEIVLGTVINVHEAVKWLSYTYLEQRLKINPQVYGINYTDVQRDPSLYDQLRKFIHIAANLLDKARMIRFNPDSEDFVSTDLGRTASHYYINYDTVQLFNNCIEPFMTEKELLDMISQAEEFNQLKIRNEECEELEGLLHDYCELVVAGGSSSVQGKVNVLMQTYLSRGFIKNFSMVSDMAYITQNVVRICRALFDIALHQNNPTMAGRCLMLSQMFELQMWDFQSPFRQFTVLNHEIIEKVERYNLTIDRVREEEDSKYIGSLFRNQRYGELLKKCAMEFPLLDVESSMQPITRSVLRIKLTIKPIFEWNDRVHGKSSEAYWLWIEDPDNNQIYYSEHFTITKYNVLHNQTVDLAFTVPLMEPLPAQYLARITSERWLGCSITYPLSFRELILPESYPPHTDLLELQPLPLSVLKNKKFEELYKFSHFNPIQTQIFHCLYHTDNNTLVGAPTGSGKTIISELAVLRVFNHYPDQKVVYIAPLKALVRERVNDWRQRFEKQLGKTVIELTGDVTPNIRDIQRANIIITTPEKWDGLSRSWQSRTYVKQVGLIIIDEIHLLGEDRGPVLEVIVSRTNFIAANTSKKLRIIGLSTAMANAKDLANWLGIKEIGLYNFRPSVRPVPLEVHISGYPGKHYCPRMISMNKPAYQAIQTHAPDSPALVFVSSRRQTKVTAVDLISFLAADSDSKQWLHMDEYEMAQIVATVKDNNLKLCLPFGIGIHHAGLEDHDRRITEELFVNQRIQVLIATSTLAWGVNFPAHLVVVKGTEYFDSKMGRYVDMPITDVLQMMGRAGRPQYDTTGVAVVLVHDIKKNFYKKFLYEPFPVESNLLQVLPDHVNAEVVAGTVSTKSELLEYLTWTYFFRRLIQNPTYYNLPNLEPETVSGYLSELSQATLQKLVDSYCIDFNEDENRYLATPLGQIASYYYLSNETMRYFHENIRHNHALDDLLRILTRSHEFTEVPVRHNENLLNGELAKSCRLHSEEFNSPYTKTFLLLQAHFSKLEMPVNDYITDLKAVLDQTLRVTQAMIDVAANSKWLSCVLRVQQILQMIIQGCWIDDSPFLQLYDFDEASLNRLLLAWPTNFPDFCEDTLFGIKAAYKSDRQKFNKLLCSVCEPNNAKSITKILDDIPTLILKISIQDTVDGRIQEVPLTQARDICAKLYTDREYCFIVSIQRIGKKSLSVPARHFPKSKEEMWFLNIGYAASDTLIALKRIGVHGQGKYKITFVSPGKPGIYNLSLYCMSDSYIGLDQQYDICLQVSS